MKANSLIFLIVIFFIISCKKDDDMNGGNANQLSELTEIKGDSGISYNESMEKWIELKNKNGESYVYQTTTGSWTGYGQTTEIKVEGGIVTTRIYQRFKLENGKKSIIDSYKETGNTLGSHDRGAPVLTIDQLYDTCLNEYLVVSEEDNTVYFETEDHGLMTKCGFWPKGCMDDCYKGISISSFGWLK